METIKNLSVNPCEHNHGIDFSPMDDPGHPCMCDSISDDMESALFDSSKDSYPPSLREFFDMPPLCKPDWSFFYDFLELEASHE